MTPTALPTAEIAAPPEVKAARASVLNFLRDGANEYVPPAGVHWRTNIGKAPQGCIVAGTGADLEHVVARLQIELLQHDGHDRRLRGGAKGTADLVGLEET